uniref:Protein kinase domain-containing protein n=1 Tax=Hyaloperonospora arabidopsidis (strain Emoy2) TaxID=559515 RepID=M4BRB6_HYAAE
MMAVAVREKTPAQPSQERHQGRITSRETVAHKYLVDVLSGLRFLHSHGIAHRDVSLENILLRNGCAVLADFGLCVPELSSVSTSSLSRASWNHRTTAGAFCCDETVGKDYYMAPEIVARERYDPRRADIWATGIAFFILWHFRL